jgi:ribose 5-phosphate isomerase B
VSFKSVVIASDHGGLDLKSMLKTELTDKGLMVLDLGTHGPESVDYPDFANDVAEALKTGKAEFGILLCGTGIGISIAANRHAHIRAALVHDAFGAKMCRAHNDANVLVMGGRVIGPEIAKDCLEVFLSTPFEGGRHERRVGKLGTKGGS